MFMSLSAVSLSKYTWFKFVGKRAKKFNNHNKNHQLAIENGDRYGIRRIKDLYALVDLSEPSIPFKLNEKEVSLLIKNSVGMAGRKNGVKLPKGDVNMFKSSNISPNKGTKPEPLADIKQDRVHIHDNDKPTDIYPNIKTPPSKPDLIRLYNLFNSLYFDNNCPKHTVIYLSTGIKFAGIAKAKRKSETEIEYKIGMSKRSMLNKQDVTNTLLHEMIHIYLFKKGFETDVKFLYDGHGPYFKEEMHRLNALGFKILIRKEAIESNVVMGHKLYVLIIEMSDSQCRYVYSDKPFKSNIKHILDKFKEFVYIHSDLKKYTYGTTMNYFATLGLPLTDKGMYPRNVKKRPRGFTRNGKVLEELLSDLKVVEEKDITRKLFDDVRKEIPITADQLRTWRVRDFETYVSVVCHVMTGKANVRIRSLSLSSLIKSYLLTDIEVRYLQDAWKDVTDLEFINDKDVVKSNVEYMINRDLDGEEAVRFLLRQYTYPFRDRIDEERTFKLLVSMYGPYITISTEHIRKTVNRIFKDIVQDGKLVK